MTRRRVTEDMGPESGLSTSTSNPLPHAAEPHRPVRQTARRIRLASETLGFETRARPEVPEVVVGRLPFYIQALDRLKALGIQRVTSRELGEILQFTPAQVRKDLSYFGCFGRQGSGYVGHNLARDLRHVLGLNRTWNCVVVGVGRLGRAVVAYPGFELEGFRIVAAFDSDPGLIGERVGELVVQPLLDLETLVRRHNAEVGIIAVPASQAQGTVDRLAGVGVRAILNYAAATVRVPPGVQMRGIDPVHALQSMTYYLR